jgi:hypothetical protein
MSKFLTFGIVACGLVVASVVIAGNSLKTPVSEVSICAIPFDAQTLHAITRDIIDKSCVSNSYVALTDKRYLDLLAVAIQVKNIKANVFDEGFVRIKISTLNRTDIFFDQKGTAKVGDTEYQLSNDEFSRLRVFIRSIVRDDRT